MLGGSKWGRQSAPDRSLRSPNSRKGGVGIAMSLVELGSGDAVTDATDESGARVRWGGGRGYIMNGEM